MPNAFDKSVPNETRVFANAALDLHKRGLCPIPCGGEDGKRPLLKWGLWKERPSRAFYERHIDRPGLAVANLGILAGFSHITIIDCDAPGLVETALRNLRETPLITATPSGGAHAWYRTSGEPCADLRRFGLAIDIKGVGGVSVEPPSFGRHGSRAGIPYGFFRGNWDCLERLPHIRPGGLDRLCGTPDQAKPSPLPGRHQRIGEGQRNNGLFKAGLHLAAGFANADDLAGALLDINATSCTPALLASEVCRIAASAWSYHRQGTNWAGGGGFRISNSELDRMPGADALWLLAHLYRAHGARQGCFAIAARAMAEAGVIRGMSERAIRVSTRQLLEAGYLVQLHRGGSGPGDAAKFRFGTNPSAT
jgi:hypothetical protein